MSNSVTIKVPARLHLGFLDLSGESARRFGSLGLPLSEPEMVATLSRAGETVVEGDKDGRAAEHLAALSRHLGIRARHRLAIERAIPRHAGLGSGTQIAIAVAAALRTLHQLPLDVGNDAILLGRGERSGIGIASFENGGLIVDAGKDNGATQPPVVARIPFPEDWRVILVMESGQAGIHGEQEVKAFRALPPFPAASAGEICRHVLMGAMPALVERDLPAFGEAIARIQTIIGSYFAPAQGGIFTSKRVEAVIQRLAEAGAVGMGQSSWGPTGFVFAPSQDAAAEFVRAAAPTIKDGMQVRIVRGRNSGADIISSGLDLVGS